MSDDYNDSNSSPADDRAELIGRIDELEKLLASKKAEATKPRNARMRVGTDGIPVLVDAIDEPDDMSDEDALSTKHEQEVIEEIIQKVDQEISDDLDELISMLKNSIIDEVKTRLLKELGNDNNTHAGKEGHTN